MNFHYILEQNLNKFVSYFETNFSNFMQKNKYISRHKYFIKLQRELNNLYDVKWKMPYVEVEPFQSGWQCNVQIKPQYLTQVGLKDAIELGYGYEHIRLVRDVKNIRKGIAQIVFGKYVKNYFPKTKRIYPKQFDTLNKDVKKWFVKQICDKTLKPYYEISVSGNWLKLHVKPNIYTRMQQINPKVESRIQEIREIFEQNCYWSKFGRGYGWRNFNINIRQDFKRQLNKFNLEIIDNIENVRFKLGWD